MGELEGLRPLAGRLERLGELSREELVERLDVTMMTALTLGNHLADIAELIGLDRDVEDLAITPRVRQLVSDPRVRQVLEEDAEIRRIRRTQEVAALRRARAQQEM